MYGQLSKFQIIPSQSTSVHLSHIPSQFESFCRGLKISGQLSSDFFILSQSKSSSIFGL
jgi:hypothetical protein